VHFYSFDLLGFYVRSRSDSKCICLVVQAVWQLPAHAHITSIMLCLVAWLQAESGAGVTEAGLELQLAAETLQRSHALVRLTQPQAALRFLKVQSTCCDMCVLCAFLLFLVGAVAILQYWCCTVAGGMRPEIGHKQDHVQHSMSSL
jgi:hypothetical protein